MKRSIFTLLFLSAFTLSADPVDQHTARQAAANFALANDFSSNEPSLISTPFSHLYLFTFPGNKGFILLSADDRVTPILGYSLTNPFILDNMPDHIKDWLQDYDDQIDYAISQDIAPTALTKKQWTNLLDGDDVPTVTTIVAPLIQTTWAQGTYYNSSCPTINSVHCYTGCVATATAQIMKYHKHPQSGVGSHSYKWNNTTLIADFEHTTYDWKNMPNSLSNTSTNTEINAVATLMHHIGVAVEMDYDTTGSGAQTTGNPPSAETALQQYFRYSNRLHSINYAHTGDSLWKVLLKAELDSLRPILYSGRSSNSGHAFVCDGYDAQGKFHFNWGWSGYCDGFYAIGSLNPGSRTYNLRNIAAICIIPDTNVVPAKTIVTASPDNSVYGYVTGTGTYTSYKTIKLIAWANDGYLFDHWDDNSSANPRYTYATTSNYNRTAYYTTLPTETLSYCENTLWTSYGNTASYTWNWGIRYPANTIPANRTLDKVQFYSYESGTFTAKIYQGDTTNMTLMCTASLTTSSNLTWLDIPLTTPYPIDTTKSLWITLERTGAGFPMTVSGNFYGTSDCMCVYDSRYGWVPYPEHGFYYSFMIKGITSQASQPTTLQNTNTVSQDWSNPANWTPNIVPNSVTDVTINATCTIPDNYTAYARTLTLKSPLVIMPSGALSVETLTNTIASNLLLKADTTHQATLLFNSGTPQANVENCFRGTIHRSGGANNPDWQYRGFIGENSPFNWNNVVIFKWDETNNATSCWGDETQPWYTSGTGTGEKWAGFCMANYASPNTVNTYTSQLIPTSQPHTFTLTRTDSGTGSSTSNNLGVNLITNSYSAPIDMRSPDIKFGENVDSTFYFFNTLTHSGYLQNPTAAIVTYPVRTGHLLDISQYIPAGQSFAVITKANGDSLIIGKNALRPISNGRMYAPANPDDVNILEITISNANSLDRLTLIEHPSCTSDFDNGYDGTKLHRSSSPQIYAVNTFGNTAVNSDRTLLGQKIGCTPTTDNEQCTLTFNTERLKNYNELYLYDRLTHTYTDILTTPTYTFTATTTSTPRFELVGQRTASENFVTSSDPMLEIISNRALASGFSDPDLIIYLSDLKGTILWSDRISNGPWFTLPTNLPPGIYILHCANISTKYLPR